MINDFDEVCRLPYTCDLVRLATSAYLAIEAEHLKISSQYTHRSRSCAATAKDLSPAAVRLCWLNITLSLRQMAVERLKQPELFWEKLKALRPGRERCPPARPRPCSA